VSVLGVQCGEGELGTGLCGWVGAGGGNFLGAEPVMTAGAPAWAHQPSCCLICTQYTSICVSSLPPCLWSPSPPSLQPPGQGSGWQPWAPWQVDW
jgi:hypothetical protein